MDYLNTQWQEGSSSYNKKSRSTKNPKIDLSLTIQFIGEPDQIIPVADYPCRLPKDDEPKNEDFDLEKPLPVFPTVHYHGFDYIQVYLGSRSCLCQQTLHGKTVGYEVFLICIQPEININGEIYLEHEHWRRDADFGKTAWSCWTLEQAKERFNLLES